jgi:hypothetical protein
MHAAVCLGFHIKADKLVHLEPPVRKGKWGIRRDCSIIGAVSWGYVNGLADDFS